MGDTEYFCNLPGVTMTRHRLSEGVIEIHEDSGMVTLELWNGRTATMELTGNEDAEVLKYAAHCLEYFAEQKAEEEEEKPAAATEKPKIVAPAAAAKPEAPPAGRQERLGLAAAGGD